MEKHGNKTKTNEKEEMTTGKEKQAELDYLTYHIEQKTNLEAMSTFMHRTW